MDRNEARAGGVARSLSVAPFNADDYRIDTCAKCGRPDAVRRRARRRHCESCRLYDASARATAKAKQLADLADRAFLTRRLLVMRVEDERMAAHEARLKALDAGDCDAPSALLPFGGFAWPMRVCVEPVIPPARCETNAVDFKMRHHYRARTAIAHAYAAMLSVGAGSTPARYNGTLLRRAFGSCDFRRKGGKLSGAGGYPSRTERVTVRFDGGGYRCDGSMRCASTQTEVRPCV